MHKVGDFLKRMGATEVSFTPYNVTYLQVGHAFPKCTYSDWYPSGAGLKRGEPAGGRSSSSGLGGNHPPQFRIGRSHWAWYFTPGSELKEGTSTSYGQFSSERAVRAYGVQRLRIRGGGGADTGGGISEHFDLQRGECAGRAAGVPGSGPPALIYLHRKSANLSQGLLSVPRFEGGTA